MWRRIQCRTLGGTLTAGGITTCPVSIDALPDMCFAGFSRMLVIERWEPAATYGTEISFRNCRRTLRLFRWIEYRVYRVSS